VDVNGRPRSRASYVVRAIVLGREGARVYWPRVSALRVVAL